MALAAAMFVAGFFAFQYVAITRHLPRDVDALARHTIFHSVVIGLGVPESDLSRREGLTWADGAANAAAQRVDPKAAYLSKSYETALFNYYTGLWSRYPREMMQVYWMKARTAGKHMLEILRDATGQDRPAPPGRARADGPAAERRLDSCSCMWPLRPEGCGGSGAVGARSGRCWPS